MCEIDNLLDSTGKEKKKVQSVCRTEVKHKNAF